MKNHRLSIITGGSKGLGASLCAKFLDLGYQVVEFSRSGIADYSIRIDLADPEWAQTVFSETFSRLAANEYDAIVAINNAGVIAPIGPAARKASWYVRKNLNVNFVSQILFIRSFVESFQKHQCRKTLVNISSGAALKGYFGWSLYCASKAGVENFIRALAVEQSREEQPITAFNVDPGIIDTDMQAGIRGSCLEDFPEHPMFVSFKETGALRKPLDVASAIVQLIDQNPLGGDRLSVAKTLNSKQTQAIAKR